MKKFTKLVMVIVSVTLFSISCKDNLDLKEKNSIREEKMLEFKDYDEFYSTLLKIGKMSGLERANFDLQNFNRNQFTSMNRIFNAIITEENINLDNEIKNNLQIHKKSDLLKKYTQIIITNNDGSYQINLADHRMDILLNGNGIVKIGNLIHQYTKTLNKAMLDRPNFDEKNLLHNTTATNEKEKLWIGKTSFKTSKNAKNMYSYRQCGSLDDGSGASKYRLYVMEEAKHHADIIGYDDYYQPIFSNYQTAEVILHTQRRGLFGAWFNINTDQTKVSGRFNIISNNSSYINFYQGNFYNGFYDYVDLTPNNENSYFYSALASSYSNSYLTSGWVYNSNIEFDSQSNHTGTFWREGRTCTCTIQ